jgi:hypothetical protein
MIEDLKSEPLFVMRLDVGYDDVQRIGLAPAGNRAIFPVHGGSFAKLFARREVAAYDQLNVRTTPRFEISDPRYDWLNRTIAVANGTRTEDGPIYQVFEIQ